MNFDWKKFAVGAAIAVGVLFIWELLSGQSTTNTGTFNTESYQ